MVLDVEGRPLARRMLYILSKRRWRPDGNIQQVLRMFDHMIAKTRKAKKCWVRE